MIAIINVSEHPSHTGEQTYELRINERVLARFMHVREQGLALCLFRAACAAQEYENEEQELVRKSYMELAVIKDDI